MATTARLLHAHDVTKVNLPLLTYQRLCARRAGISRNRRASRWVFGPSASPTGKQREMTAPISEDAEVVALSSQLSEMAGVGNDKFLGRVGRARAAAAGVHIVESPGRGAGLYATRAFPDAGTEVIVEPPLLLARTAEIESPENQATLQNTGIPARFWAGYKEFAQAPEDVQEAILKLHAPTDGNFGQAMTTTKRPSLVQQMCEGKTEEEAQRIVSAEKLVMDMVFSAMQHNEVECALPAEDSSGADVDIGVGLFEILSRVNHSCAPNAVWIGAGEDGSRALRTVVPVVRPGRYIARHITQRTSNPRFLN